jgi:hypothetical protein
MPNISMSVGITGIRSLGFMALAALLAGTAAAQAPELPDDDKPLGTLERIEVIALVAKDSEDLLSRLPLRPGDKVTPRLISGTAQIVHEFDERLRSVIRRDPRHTRGGDIETKLTLVISYAQGTANADGKALPQRVRVGAKVMAEKMVESVPPRLPSSAPGAGEIGLVRLRVIVAKDGRVKELEVMKGHPYFVHPVLEAVGQWRYRETLVNGTPVEVETEVEMMVAVDPGAGEGGKSAEK